MLLRNRGIAERLDNHVAQRYPCLPTAVQQGFSISLVPILKWKSATTGSSSSFQIRNEQFFARSRRSRDCAETYKSYVAQEIPQIDTEIAEKGHFWMETS